MARRFWAPGRVNLIGDHTDYSGGLVLPAAIDRGLTLTGEAAATIRLTSDEHDGVIELAPDGAGDPGDGWGRYVAAVAAELDELGRPPAGLHGHLGSTLPEGAGLSSSAALEVAVGVALCAVADFELAPLELAKACQRAEQRAVEVPSGIMDQAASLLGRAGHAVLLDCGALVHRLVPLPEDVSLLVVDSGVTRKLEASGYAQRRAELEAGLEFLDRPARDLTLDDVTKARSAGLDDVSSRRVRHVVTENARVRAATDILSVSEPVDRSALARQFAASHASLREDYEVTVPETDLLVELCLDAGAFAARMTGGGFGGAVVALVDAGQAEAIEAKITDAYAAREDRWRASAWVCRAADGAGER